MYKRLKYYIQDKELSYIAQYGFRETFSTQHAILVNWIPYEQIWTRTEMFPYGVFLDFWKAFDTEIIAFR